MIPRLSLRAYLGALVLVTMLPLAGLLGYNIQERLRADEAGARRSVTELAQSAAQNLAQFVAQTRHVATAIAQHGLVRNFDPASCTRAIELYAGLYRDYANLVAFDRKGDVVCSALPVRGAKPPSARDREFFQRVMRENAFVISEPHVGRITQRWVVIFAAPVRNEARRPAGVVGLPVDLLNLQLDVRSLPVQQAVVRVISASGRVVASTHDAERWIGHDARGTEIVDHVLRHKSGSVRATGIDGVEYVFAFTGVSGTDWYVSVGAPVHRIFAAAYQQLRRDLIAYAAMIVLVTLFSLFIARNIVRPVDRIARTAAAVSDGDFNARVEPSGPSEIAATAARFNAMLDAQDVARRQLRESERTNREQYAELDHLYRTASIGLALYDREFQFVRINERLAEINGLSVEQHIGRALPQVLPELWPTLEPIFHRVMSGESVPNVEIHGVTRAQPGVERDWLASYYPVHADDGAVRGVSVAVQEVTERKQAEAVLRASEERFRTLAEAAPIGIFLTEPTGECVYTNPAWTAISGLSHDDCLGYGWTRAIHPDDAQRVKESRAATAARGEKFETEYRVLTPAGDMRWVHAIATPQRDASGTVVSYVGSVVDITERKAAEEALREASRRTSVILESITDAFVSLDAQWRYTYVNKKAAEIFGRQREDLIGKHIWTEFPEGVGQPFYKAYYKAVAEQVPIHLEEYYPPYDRWFENHIYPLPDGLSIYFRDITRRKQREEALRANEERLRLALDAAHMGTFDWDIPRNHITWSRWHRELWGFAPGEFGGTYEAFAERVHPQDLPGVNAEVARCIETREPFAREFRVVWPDGSVRWIAAQGEFVFDERGQAVRMRGVVLETTGRRQAEEALREQAERLHELSKRLIEVQEAERRAIAQEMHDRIGQNLSALSLNLGIIRGQLPGNSTRALDVRLDDAQKLLEVTSRQVRDVMADLRPVALDDYGLLAALRAYVEPFSRRVGVPVSVHGEDLAPRPPLAQEMALFRIAQEGLNNAAKHAHARTVEVTLAATARCVSLTIADDGAGFDPQVIARSRRHWGMTTMRERAEAIGAGLRVESAPGNGTRVVVEVPRDGA